MFTYTDASHSTAAHADIINDFMPGEDLLDLSAIAGNITLDMVALTHDVATNITHLSVNGMDLHITFSGNKTMLDADDVILV